MRYERWMIGVAAGLVVVAATGCGPRRKSSLLLERQARGALEEERGIATEVRWMLSPTRDSKTTGGVEVFVEYAPPAYLQDFFRNRKIFQEFAGLNPYFSEQMVFYVKVANNSQKRIRITPSEFVLLDDKGSQYNLLQSDYVMAMAEAKAPMSTVTRGVLDDARPGYFGFGVPVGKIFPKSQQRFALLQLSQLKEGQLQPGVVYDGLISFWNPHEGARTLKLLLGNIKTDFNPNDEAQTSLDFVFEMSAVHSNHQSK